MKPALVQGEVVEIHGWVMLAKLPAGRYRVKSVGTINGILAYAFARPQGTKVIVVHACDNVDPWLRDSRDDPDINKIIRITNYKSRLLRAGDICPSPGCGHILLVASPSGGYLECPSGHVHAARVRCQSPGCRRIATSFQHYTGFGRKATCEEHDSWPFA
jgi:hypothetical protein